MLFSTNLLTRAGVLALLLGTTGLLSGCETTIELPEPKHTPRVALQYLLRTTDDKSDDYNATQLRRLYLSTSQRVFDTRQLSGRADATVVLTNGQGAVVEQFTPVSSGAGSNDVGYYEKTTAWRPQPGQTYTLRASLPGFETVESTLTMPAVPVIESASFTRKPDPNNPSASYGPLSVTVADDPAVANYYVAFVRLVDEQGNTPNNWSSVFVTDDNSGGDFSLEGGQFRLSDISSFSGNGYQLFPFADTNVNGKRFSLNANISYYGGYCPQPGACAQPAHLDVYVSSITRDAYNFYLSRQRYQDSQNNPFAEPAPLATNLQGGYGLFGGATEAVYRIKL